MRLRRDSWYQAGLHRRLQQERLSMAGWQREWIDEMLATPAALPGDCWPVKAIGHPDLLGGYVLVCPIETCDAVTHLWDHAYNCPRRHNKGPCERGDGRQPGISSCWDWTGDPDLGTLTATPSLQVLAAGAGYPPTCEFHGFLTNGVLA